ncbi:MAG: hypothetical protein KDA75_04935 [Planctomycetaceae bacterium]|nr:hypothetical protein [Planctomycetaceae bacterium]
MRYEQLDPDKIVETVAVLSRRVKERFPQAGLNQVCVKLLEVSRRARERAAEIESPIVWARCLSGGIILLLTLLLVGAVWTTLKSDGEESKLSAAELVQVVEAALNELVAIGITIFFLISIETRLKRRKALQAVHELRVISHIIDMHQLTKDPERMLQPSHDTASSPKRTMNPFELNRYLDYCSEMLALVGKIAALYVQNFPDEQAVGAVNDVEDLTAGMARKIWQKIMILHSHPGSSEQLAILDRDSNSA